LLIGVFVLTLTLRLLLAFLIPNFTYDSYFNLRQVQHIQETGLPLYNDPLSYGGREQIFLPLFHYLIAGFSFILPLEIAAKILPNLFLALLTIIIYYLSYKITENERSSLVSAILVGILPVIFYTNNFGVESFTLPLIFFAILCFLNLPKQKYLYLYLLSFIILCFTSPTTFLLIIGLGIYLLLSYLENKKINEEEKEVLLFSLFTYLWIQFLFFKRVFLQEGIAFIQQNVPIPIIQSYFPQISILGAIALVGVIPFVIGIYVVYKSLFRLKNRKIYLLISLVIATTTLSWFKLIRFNFSLDLFGVTLAVLFACFYQDLIEYVDKTKGVRLRKYLPYIIILILLISILPLSISTAWKQDTPTEEVVDSFKWLAQNTPNGTGALALMEEGNLVTYYGQRRNLMDGQFSLIPDVEKRFEDTYTLFTGKFQTVALKKTDQYKLQYLILTPTAQAKYKISSFSYLSPDCFKKIYDNSTQIYHVICTLKEMAADESRK